MEIRAVLPTAAGLHALWGPEHFPNIVDYETWEPELLEDEDLERHIAAGHLVPVNIQSDGAFAITVRIDPVEQPVLSALEHPDFIIVVGPVATVSFRSSVQTFEGGK